VLEGGRGRVSRCFKMHQHETTPERETWIAGGKGEHQKGGHAAATGGPDFLQATAVQASGEDKQAADKRQTRGRHAARHAARHPGTSEANKRIQYKRIQ